EDFITARQKELEIELASKNGRTDVNDFELGRRGEYKDRVKEVLGDNAETENLLNDWEKALPNNACGGVCQADADAIIKGRVSVPDDPDFASQVEELSNGLSKSNVKKDAIDRKLLAEGINTQEAIKAKNKRRVELDGEIKAAKKKKPKGTEIIDHKTGNVGDVHLVQKKRYKVVSDAGDQNGDDLFIIYKNQDTGQTEIVRMDYGEHQEAAERVIRQVGDDLVPGDTPETALEKILHRTTDEFTVNSQADNIHAPSRSLNPLEGDCHDLCPLTHRAMVDNADELARVGITEPRMMSGEVGGEEHLFIIAKKGDKTIYIDPTEYKNRRTGGMPRGDYEIEGTVLDSNGNVIAKGLDDGAELIPYPGKDLRFETIADAKPVRPHRIMHIDDLNAQKIALQNDLDRLGDMQKNIEQLTGIDDFTPRAPEVGPVSQSAAAAGRRAQEVVTKMSKRRQFARVAVMLLAGGGLIYLVWVQTRGENKVSDVKVIVNRNRPSTDVNDGGQKPPPERAVAVVDLEPFDPNGDLLNADLLRESGDYQPEVILPKERKAMVFKGPFPEEEPVEKSKEKSKPVVVVYRAVETPRGTQVVVQKATDPFTGEEFTAPDFITGLQFDIAAYENARRQHELILNKKATGRRLTSEEKAFDQNFVTQVAVDVDVNYQLNQGFTNDQVKPVMKSNVQTYFDTLQVGDDLVVESIETAATVDGVEDVQVTLPNQDVTMQDGQVAILGAFT
ncbi:MAG: hypothetical protein QF632_02805, partial [Candidatus Woesearchaeota archaeon]|nr:hypothetical protein [Candidatus Woesearchaeota archaeon]